jgi:hypothetical protein
MFSVLIFDYMKQEQIKRFLHDYNAAERFKTILNDGCVIVHECVVHAAATRSSKSVKSLRKQNLRPLAHTVLAASEMRRLLAIIEAVAELRNVSAHEPMTDEQIRVQFIDAVDAWKRKPYSRGDRAREVGLAHVTFAWIVFELGRWQVGLPPSWSM